MSFKWKIKIDFHVFKCCSYFIDCRLCVKCDLQSALLFEFQAVQICLIIESSCLTDWFGLCVWFGEKDAQHSFKVRFRNI